MELALPLLQQLPALKVLAEAGGALVALVAAVGGIWWKVSRAFAKTQVEMHMVLHKLEKIAQTNLELTKAVVQLATKLDEREKDIAKLEGVVDAQRRDFMQVITTMQEAVGSLKALWRTLHHLHPESVPKRAGEKL